MRPRIAAIALLSLITGVMCSAQPVEYVCPAVDEAPVLDAALDDACWQQAPEPPTFYRVGIGGEAAPAQTRVRFVMDEEALYVGVDADTREGEMPVARERERDGKVWYDAGIELFLSPSFVDDTYYQLAFNAVGSYTDLRNAPGLGFEEKAAWNPQWALVAEPREGGWSAEARIPWVAFGLEGAPPRGWVWRVRVGSHAQSMGNSMWPLNEDTSFHNPQCWAYLIMRDGNLVTNPGLEAGPREGGGQPEGWLFAYNDREGTGEITVSDEMAASGRYSARLEKFDDLQYFPVVYVAGLDVQPGSTYVIEASVNSPKDFRMRYNLIGEAGDKRGQPMPATEGFERVRMTATIPESGVDQITVGWQYIRTKATLCVDDVLVYRDNSVRGTAEQIVEPHPYHRLEELASRTAFKPYHLLQREDGSFQSDRVIFRDSGTGAEIWMLARSGGASTRHQYMEMSPWNADHTLLALHSGQLGKGTLLLPADASSYRRLLFYASGPQWDRLDPKRMWFRKYRGHGRTDLWDLAWGDVTTGETTTCRRFEGNLAIWPQSLDGQRLLVEEELYDENDEMASRLWLMERDGMDGLMLEPGGWAHQCWFTKRGDYSVEFEWEGQKPQGAYVIDTDSNVRKVSDTAYGHRAHQPGGPWIAIIGPCAVKDIETGELRVISSENSGHQTWRADPDWYATSSRRYLRRVIAFGDSPTTQLLGAHNSQLKHSTYWSESHPEMSADGTKLGYASSMLGDIEFYWLVMRLPDPPRDLRLAHDGDRVRLSWQPGEKHAETRGYLVYRSDASGRPGECLTPDPIAATEFVDTPDGVGYYCVTAVEHCGLESLHSNEACSDASWPGDATVVVEAERGSYAEPAAEVFDASASGLYAVSLGRLQASEGLTVPVTLPRAGQWRLWALAKASSPTAVASGPFGEASVQAGEWAWVSFPEAASVAGEISVALTTDAPGIEIDRIALTTADVPPDIEDVTAPAAPGGLSVQAEGRYVTRLRWDAVGAADVHHYNVYAAAGDAVQVNQERLIASPSDTEYVDWGLKAGQGYAYRVTAVDRAGNESAPSEVASASTAPIAARLLSETEHKWNTREVGEIELPFTMPADGEFVAWGYVQSLNGARSASVEMLLDGEPLATHRIAFDYICVGHGGPVLNTWLWDCMRPRRDEIGQPMAYAAAAGEHVLTLRATEGLEVLFERFVVTNDLGYEPEGTVDFRVPPSDG